jgi:hypothetical protein
LTTAGQRILRAGKAVCYILDLAHFAAQTPVITQTPTEPKRPQSTVPQQKVPRVEVYWTTVTYKTVAIYVILVAAIVFAGLYLAKPDWYSVAYKKLSNAISTPDTDALPISQTQAKFVNLDGKVQVKKVNSVQWVDADYRTTLDKGDLVQTINDGVARIAFGDGTTYTVKADTLVTVEQNNVQRDHADTAVRINTGSVDLATPNWSSPDSKAAVSVEDTIAQVKQNSRATVKTDPEKKESEIVVSSGSAEVQRGQEKVEIGQYQKASFATGGPITKSDVLAPPDLASPRNLEPLIVENPKTAAVHFEWKPVTEAVSYTIRISATAMFTKMVKEMKVSGASTDISGLDAGEYFWSVTATDAKKQSSEASETFKFTLVAQGKSQDMLLEINTPQLQGHVAEISGRTEPGAALIINGQPVANIAPDGTFRHFTEPLTPGEHNIVVIGQNRRGGTAKQQVSVVVPR